MKKTIGALLMMAAACLASSLVCPAHSQAASAFDPGKEINVVSREDGSGTRGAFIELFGIEQKVAGGGKKDMTSKDAVIAKETDIMMTNIAGDRYAIGYASLGSVNHTIKTVPIDGAEASAANIKAGSYKVARPFFIATKGEPNAAAKDFISFILSAQGQQIVGKDYISISDSAASYQNSGQTGKVTVAGSSSVTPVMEKLREAYLAINPGAVIEVQQSDSTAGMTAAINGICDIGMASRDLKDSEKQKLTPVQIATDGIAIIVNNDNPITALTKDQVKAIYTGKETHWHNVIK